MVLIVSNSLYFQKFNGSHNGSSRPARECGGLLRRQGV
jgi:hypothetical protein